jgi:hypothetical protein
MVRGRTTAPAGMVLGHEITGAVSSFRRHELNNGASCENCKMPWKVCKPMDVRLKFIAGCWTGNKWWACAESSASPLKPATRSNESGGGQALCHQRARVRNRAATPLRLIGRNLDRRR